VAELLGRPLGLTHVLHVVSAAAVAAPHAAASLVVERPATAVTRLAARGVLRAAAALAAGQDAPVLELREGDPVQELRAAADEAEADAIVVGTRGQGALRSGLGGSVALELARHAERPVVIVPPSPS
jgi:nucleotide-binding universal stress UspA family protein